MNLKGVPQLQVTLPCLLIYMCLPATILTHCPGAKKEDRLIYRYVERAKSNLSMPISQFYCEVGSLLSAQCDLQFPSTGDEQYFTSNKECIDYSIVNYMGNGTALLSYENVTTEMDNTSVKCCMYDMECIESTVYVDYKPLEPVISEIVYHKENSSLYFKWSLNYTHICTNKIYYRACIFNTTSKTDNSRRLVCYNTTVTLDDIRKAGNSYQCELKNTSSVERIKVVVRGYNIVGKVRTARNVPLKSIRKLEPVADFQVNSGSHDITVTWNHTEAQGSDIDAQLYYNSSRSKLREKNVTQEKGKVGCHKFQALHPFTNYSISVRVKSLESEVWSDWRNTTVQTLPSVPGANPMVTLGGFESTGMKESGSRDILLYWQEVPYTKQNGVITGYIVSCLSRLHNRRVTNSTSHTFSRLPLEEVVVLSVTAQTTEGVNYELATNTVVVPPERNIPSIPDNFTVIVVNERRGLVNISWASPSNDTTGMTIFHCKEGKHFNTLCKGQLNWREINGKQMFRAVTLNNLPGAVSEMRYGLSVNKCMDSGCVSSGIKWADKVYFLEHKAKSPVVRAGSTCHWSFKCEILVTSAANTAYVYAYKFQYCLIKPGEGCTDLHVFYKSPEETVVIIPDLLPGQTYELRATSVTAQGESHPSGMVTFRTLPVVFTASITSIVLVISIIAFVFFVIGIMVVVRKQIQCCQWINKRLMIQISLPDHVVDNDDRRQDMTTPSWDSSSAVTETEDSLSQDSDGEEGNLHYSRDAELKSEPQTVFPFGNRSESLNSFLLDMDFLVLGQETMESELASTSCKFALANNVKVTAVSSQILVEHKLTERKAAESMAINLMCCQTCEVPAACVCMSSNLDQRSDEVTQFEADINTDTKVENKHCWSSKSLSGESLSGFGHGYASGQSVKGQLAFCPIPNEPAMPLFESSWESVTSDSHRVAVFAEVDEGPPTHHLADDKDKYTKVCNLQSSIRKQERSTHRKIWDLPKDFTSVERGGLEPSVESCKQSTRRYNGISKSAGNSMSSESGNFQGCHNQHVELYRRSRLTKIGDYQPFPVVDDIQEESSPYAASTTPRLSTKISQYELTGSSEQFMGSLNSILSSISFPVEDPENN